MKKFIVLTLMLSIAGIAFASSLAVPWFVDNAQAAAGLPPTSAGVSGIVYLKNNTDAVATCSITYYTQTGGEIGPPAPGNTFVIQPLASLSFRPSTSDPDSVSGGQEAVLAGWLVPDRPPWGNSSSLPADPDNDGKKNGSIVIRWLGDDTDVQGTYVWTQAAGTALKIVCWGHLLPPGV